MSARRIALYLTLGVTIASTLIVLYGPVSIIVESMFLVLASSVLALLLVHS